MTIEGKPVCLGCIEAYEEDSLPRDARQRILLVSMDSECVRTDVGLSPNVSDVPFGKPEPLGSLLDNLRHGEGKADIAADSTEAKAFNRTPKIIQLSF